MLRAQWKEELLKIGYDETWTILATTDAASNVRSARHPGRHEDIGLKVKYETDCVDHQVKQIIIKKMNKLLKVKESHCRFSCSSKIARKGLLIY